MNLRSALARGLTIALVAVGAHAGGPEVAAEYRIKAAFLYNFVKFVQWPASAYPDDRAAAAIGVYCAETFGDALREVVRGRTAGGRSVEIRVLHAANEAREVQLVFVCSEFAVLWPPVVNAVRDRPVLTVADKAGPVPAGAIEFEVEGDAVRFRLNLPITAQAGLKVSDQLAKLAKPARGVP